jgi:RsiW-degrading membrane proteinase PrsW (M82 family)
MIALGIILSIVVGLIPTGLYAIFVNWLDQHEKEPWWLLALTFLWGGVPAVILALIAQTLLDIPTTWVLESQSLAYEIVGSSLWAPITEEIVKGFGVLLVLLLFRREIDSVLDGIIYGAMAGLGFAVTENVLYFTSALTEDGWGGWIFLVLIRTIPFGLNHALFTGLTGAGLATASHAKSTVVRLVAPAAGLFSGMLFHAIHNLGASLAGLACASICLSFVFDWGGILLLGILVVLVWRQERSWIETQLVGEMSQEMISLLISWQKWQRARWSRLVQGDISAWRRLRQIRQAATELAFTKQRWSQSGADEQLAQRITQDRQRLAELIEQEKRN